MSDGTTPRTGITVLDARFEALVLRIEQGFQDLRERIDESNAERRATQRELEELKRDMAVFKAQWKLLAAVIGTLAGLIGSLGTHLVIR